MWEFFALFFCLNKFVFETSLFFKKEKKNNKNKGTFFVFKEKTTKEKTTKEKRNRKHIYLKETAESCTIDGESPVL